MASAYYKEKSPLADETIRSLSSRLPDAVGMCIAAAGFVLQADVQKMLLLAASFGKTYLNQYPAEDFVQMCRTLRVLNAVRHADIGIPITYAQLQMQAVDVLIKRLIARRLFWLAFRICEYLGMSTNSVIIEWVCEKIKQNIDDDEIAHAILARVGGVRGVPYEQFVLAALNAGKSALAKTLLQNEPAVSKQVQLLLKMHDYDAALEKAVDSGDADLIYLVLLELRQAAGVPSNFFFKIRSMPAAVDAFVHNWVATEPQLVMDFYEETGRIGEGAMLSLQLAFREPNLELRRQALRSVLGVVKPRKEQALLAHMIEDQLRLYDRQQELRSTMPSVSTDVFSLSLYDTMGKYIAIGNYSKADALRKEFKVDDRQYAPPAARTWARGCAGRMGSSPAPVCARADTGASRSRRSLSAGTGSSWRRWPTPRRVPSATSRLPRHAWRIARP